MYICTQNAKVDVALSNCHIKFNKIMAYLRRWTLKLKLRHIKLRIVGSVCHADE